MTPALSVIMPVYNGARFLREAVDSVLAQSFRDFELVIIDDCSTDDSARIIRSYADERIRFLQNEQNIGLIATLNRSIDLCRGKYIARMDQDDVSLPDRFAIQVKHLETHPETGVICAPVIGITPGGKLRDEWPADAAARSYEQIKRTLPKENCIAHPTVMVRSELMRAYRYSTRQKGSEDWDLWLRLVRDGIRIEKTRETLLYYRLHPGSSTITTNLRTSPQLRNARSKWRFFIASAVAGKLNGTVARAAVSIIRDLGYFTKSSLAPSVLRKSRWLLVINPVRAAADLRWLNNVPPASRYFIFSYSHMGGAERVHASIVSLVKDKNPIVLFTGLSDKGGLEREFGDSTKVRNISAGLYHPFFSGRVRKLLDQKIGANSKTLIFGSNSSFFYELLLRLPPRTVAIDLTHDVSYKNNRIRASHLAALLRLDHRVFISNRALNVTAEMYQANFVDDEYHQRLRLIYNYTPSPPERPIRQWSAPFRILYAGRDSPEKRLDIIVRLAALASQKNLPFEFIIVGDVKKRHASDNVIFAGEINDRGRMAHFYSEAHFVIITSSSEGFPLSLMEGMASGCIPVATSVGDIPHHIEHDKNGLLLPKGNKDEVLAAGVLLLENITSFDLPRISGAAAGYCASTFGYERFRDSYLSLFRV